MFNRLPSETKINKNKVENCQQTAICQDKIIEDQLKVSNDENLKMLLHLFNRIWKTESSQKNGNPPAENLEL